MGHQRRCVGSSSRQRRFRDGFRRELGYEFGVPSMSPCSTYGAADLCGSSTVPVAMQDLVCSGGELSVKDCTWSEPSAATHEQDSILFCGSSSDGPADGSVRLLRNNGAPSLSSNGFVEIYLNKQWSSVCGLSSGAESLVCRGVGFAGAATERQPQDEAWSLSTPNVGDLTCSGGEESVLGCSFESGDDVYCAPAEASFISCA